MNGPHPPAGMMMIHFESDYVNATIIICLQLNRRLTPRARDVIGAFIVRYGSRIWILDSVHILSVDYLDTTSRAVSSVIISGVHSKHFSNDEYNHINRARLKSFSPFLAALLQHHPSTKLPQLPSIFRPGILNFALRKI